MDNPSPDFSRVTRGLDHLAPTLADIALSVDFYCRVPGMQKSNLARVESRVGEQWGSRTEQQRYLALL